MRRLSAAIRSVSRSISFLNSAIYAPSLRLRARHLKRHKQQKHGGIWFLISSASDFQINWIWPGRSSYAAGAMAKPRRVLTCKHTPGASGRLLADVRTLIGHLPKEVRARDTWQHVEAELEKAAAGGDTKQVSIALRWCCNWERSSTG
jgi:hypothetical protein